MCETTTATGSFDVPCSSGIVLTGTSSNTLASTRLVVLRGPSCPRSRTGAERDAATGPNQSVRGAGSMQFEGISSGMDDYGSGFGVTAEPSQKVVNLGEGDSWVRPVSVFVECYLTHLHHGGRFGYSTDTEMSCTVPLVAYLLTKRACMQVIVCSDGLFSNEARGGGGGLTNQQIVDICDASSEKDPERIAEQLCLAAQAAGSTDDVSVVIMKL